MSTTTPTLDMLAVATEAVRLAALATSAVSSGNLPMGKLSKNDKSPVTVADFAAQAVVALHLQAELHQPLTMVGEESADALRAPDAIDMRHSVLAAVRVALPDAQEDAILDAIDLGCHDGRAETYWTLDPVDGTKGFLRGGQYAIALAWLKAGQVALGVMGAPHLPKDKQAPPANACPPGCLFGAVRGQGAWQAPMVDPAARENIRVADWSPGQPIASCESVEAAHSRQDIAAQVLKTVGGSLPVRLDSQAKYGMVARGQAHAYLRLPTRPGYVERIWDHAAGSLIAREAGAVVTDIDGHALDFGHGRGLEQNRGIVCASPQLHPQLIEALSGQF